MNGRTAVVGIAVAVIAAGVAGCVALLPKAQNEVQSPWRDFAEARAAIERIVPYQTTRQQLQASGIDPFASPNISLLTYSDVILRFPLGGAVPRERVDRGLRECLDAGKACYGYAIVARDTKRDRTANFWLDSLGFYRQVDVTGWSFNATILLIDDLVVYTLYGGQPIISEHEISTQPLGPIQNWGDTLPAMVH